MPNDLKRIKTQIDFTAARGSSRSELIYKTLMHYNRASGTDMTASELIVEAFSRFDPTEAEDITELFDAHTRTSAFLSRYDIHLKRDIMTAAEEKDLSLDVSLSEPKKKFFCFDAGDEDAKRMWDVLCGIRFRDRGAFLNKVLFQFFAHGHCPFYNDLCSERMLFWLKEELILSKKLGVERFGKVADLIWQSAQSGSGDDETPGEYAVAADSEDRLRKAMGLL